MLTPNIGVKMRAFYGAAGVVLIAAPLIVSTGGAVRWVLPLLGLIAIITGAVGW